MLHTIYLIFTCLTSNIFCSEALRFHYHNPNNYHHLILKCGFNLSFVYFHLLQFTQLELGLGNVPKSDALKTFKNEPFQVGYLAMYF